jgi:hypothetical protein
MAAGIGSRFGGLKQIEPVGPGGELVIDFSVYDAARAGFGKVVFLIRREIEEVFKEKVGRFAREWMEVGYAFQSLDALPPGFTAPPERKKPWGTGHAVLCCRGAVQGSFAAINADDFYGREAFEALAGFLQRPEGQEREGVPLPGCMAGYRLGNTLSEHGSVARGVCQVSADGELRGIHEVTRIQRVDGQAMCSEDGLTWSPVAEDTTVSMNMWGFTAGFFAELERIFPLFLERNAARIEKAEFYLPEAAGELIGEERMRVRVLPVAAKWFGVTYPEDLPGVRAGIRALVEAGVYPKKIRG